MKRNWREWASSGEADLTEAQRESLSTIVTSILGAGVQLIHEDVLQDTDGELIVAATIVFKFERFKGDKTPFMAVASIPDIPQIAIALISSAAEAFEEVDTDNG